MPMRDARFGQFADPSFGASLSHSSPGSPGVLPTPDAAPSASAPPAQQPNFGGGSGAISMPALGPGLMGGGGRRMFLAAGGAIPDETQDSGNAMPAGGDPFGIIKQALTYGRKKMGLPENFFGRETPPSNDAEATNKAAGEEGATGQIQDDDLRAFQNNQIMNNLQPGEQGQWGDTTLQGKDKTAYLAEGGSIEDDTGVDDQQGVIPDSPQPDQAGGGSQNAMAYLTGQGGVGPEVAAALERQVDPQGTMDPNMRKMMAVSQAGSPEKAFQVLQHYRQKFNAYNAFAKAAAQGAGGRPPDLRASTQAATQAYQHLPDGTALDFMPVQGGVRVAVRKIIPSKPAPSGGEDNTQREQPTQSFAEGGSVEDDDFNMETAGSETPSGSSYDREQQATAAQGDTVTQALGGRAPHEALKDFVLSIPAYLGWLSKDGQADSVLDQGAETTLAKAAAQSQQQAPQAPQPGAVPAPGPQGPQAPNPTPGLNQDYQQGIEADRNARQEAFTRQTPRNAEAFGAKVGTEGGKEGATLADVLHEIDQAYPTVGMSQQRALARAAARQHWADNYAKIEAEQTRSQRAENVARIGATARQGVAETNKSGKIEATNITQTHGDARATNKFQTQRDIAAENRNAAMDRTKLTEAGKNDRNDVTNKPSLVGNREKIEQARQARQPAAAPQGNPVTSQQPSAADIEYLRKNPNVAAKFDARFGAGASQRVLGQ